MKTTLLLACLSAAASASMAATFHEVVGTHFKAWDTDHDTVLSIVEIEHAVASPANTGAAAAAIASLRRAVRTKSFKLPPLTLGAIRQLVPKPQGREDLPDLEEMFASALNSIDSSTSELLVPAKLGLDCLEQGKLGDCFCLAPLGAMLHRDPAEVVRMFGQGNDGFVSVTLGGGRVFRVPFPTDAERALMATSDGSGVWVNCYEKAVGQLKMDKDDPDHVTELNVVTRGGSAGTMLSILTGHEIVRASCLPFRNKKVPEAEKARLLDDLRRQMTATQAAGRLICGGTASGKTTAGRRPPGVRGPHAYAILNYDAPTDIVTLWDPHGDDFQPGPGPAGIQNGYPRTLGRVKVPLTELVQWFGGFSFETDQPLKAS
ncbi:MAG: peptidase C2 [Prosthecobacter sp.]|uniref:hypothetical protein n=1 Tax=Prosthecobacter sp. TaxID=1965333 RepID=UPI001A040F06|nr:hypothetical protein [Prosthecobacter sp.]MBE2287499.1 peptidase C2 [Prosthecobacter sp.]